MKFASVAFGKNPRRTLIRCAVIAVFSILVFRYALAVLRLDGMSMEPTYSHGDVVLANRLAYAWEDPQRGDVVAIRMRASGRSIFYLKRVVGLPGESIGFEDGKLMVDGEVVNESYLVYESNWDREPVLCEPDEYFLVGDNRGMPMRNHTFGRTGKAMIVGRILF